MDDNDLLMGETMDQDLDISLEDVDRQSSGGMDDFALDDLIADVDLSSLTEEDDFPDIPVDNSTDDDLDEVLSRAREGGVKRFIIPGADPKTLPRAIEIAEKYNDVYFAVGIHPYDMQSFEGLEFEKYVHHEKCVAIGECGLDYFRLEGSDEEKELECDMLTDGVIR